MQDSQNITRPGKFIVIDGTDGSGKATQTQMLANRLKTSGCDVEIADFPQYGKKSAGLVEEYLNGKYGDAGKVGPYRASIFYACDRYDASFRIKKWLDQGKIVISNRYVSANMGHQGGKIANPLDRKFYFNWLYELEYDLFKIPKPDLNIILHVDALMAQRLVDGKAKRDYLNGAKRDLHENDLDHLKEAERVYLEIAETFPDFILIECTKNNAIMTREEINNLIWREIIKLIKLNIPTENLSPNFKVLYDQTWEIHKNNTASTLKIQRISEMAKLPGRAYRNDAGLDIYAADYYSIMPGERAVIRSGLKLSIPKGYAGLVWDKGGIAKSGIHTMAGVIDSGFRGELTINLINLSHDIYNIAPGQKVAQLLIQKIEEPKIIETMIGDDTERGQGRFGSSGL